MKSWRRPAPGRRARSFREGVRSVFGGVGGFAVAVRRPHHRVGDEAGVLPDLRLDRVGDLRVLHQEALGVLLALPDPLAAVAEPGTRLFDDAGLNAQVQQLASRLGALEQRPQPRPGLDQQALDARVVPLEQQLLALAQIRERIQGLEGRLGTLDQQGQAISRLSQSVTGLEQEANRLAQEVSDTSNRSAKVAETLTLRQAEESKAQALVPGLVIEPADPKADAESLERLALWVLQRIAPIVAVDPPDGIVIDSTGADHLHGGEAAMLEAIGEFAELRPTSRLSCQIPMTDELDGIEVEIGPAI